MDHQWRPIPAPQGNICPMCSLSHFPFCPPYPPPHLPSPPYTQNPRFPPQPDYTRPDAYHPALPNPYTPNPNDGWHKQNDYGHREGFGQAMYDYSNGISNCYVGEVDRSHKRPRVEELGSGVFGQGNNFQNPATFSSDDERRLKLIRDHGGASIGNFTNLQYNSERNHQDFNTSFVGNVEINNNSSNNNKNMYSPFQPNGANHRDLHQNQINDYDSVPAKGSQYHSHMNNNWQWPEHQPYGMRDHMGPHFESPGYSEREAYVPRHENRVFGGQPPPPPLPTSPPPPLPMEPPAVHSYSSQPKLSLFPVPVSSSATNPYVHNKPLTHSHASTGFVSEVLLLCYILGLCFAQAFL